MADFAKAQLIKYGWTEGKGLGKNENGITTAIKPALKFDTAGIGHKHVDGNQWWETAFNKAASNITVDTNTNGVSISINEKGSDDTFKQKLKKKKSKSDSQYANFLKMSTLCNGNLVSENTSPANTEVESLTNNIALVQLTDEELFKACGGRTAHKGARHGLKLNGKLERIAKQEEELLNKLASSGTNMQTCTYQNKVVDKSNNLSKKNESSDENADLPLYTTSVDESELGTQSKKTRRKQKRKMNDLTYQLDTLCKVNDSTAEEQLASKNKEKAKKRKGKEHNVNVIVKNSKGALTGQERDGETGISKRKTKKSKRRRSECSQDRESHSTGLEEMQNSERKRIKKTHNKHIKDRENLKQKKKSVKTVYDLDPDSSYETENTDTADAYSKKEAERLNNKIKKKKAARRRKKIKLKLGYLMEGSQLTENSDTKNPSKCANSQKKIERIVKDLTSIEIVDDVTEKIKKKYEKMHIKAEGNE